LGDEPSFYSLSTDPANILSPDPVLAISAREREVIKFLAEGLPSKQIGERLSISTHTVDTHRRNLLKKTGTKNTSELTVYCVKKGLI
jgi:DNA-binding CsgD family transcriptional regulator